LLSLKTDGRKKFANAHHVSREAMPLVQDMKPRVVAIDLSAVPDIEYTALKGIIESERRLRDAGTMMWLVALNPAALGIVNRSSLGKTLGRERMFFTLPQAVDAFGKLSPPDSPRS
ncbi:MAG: sodium-independent anion transporter, partial [Vicinamibacterales bacterium]